MNDGEKMFNKSRFIFLIKIIIVLGIVVFALTYITSTLSKYNSVGTSQASVDIAYYLVDETSISNSLKVGGIIPRNEPYTYTITVSNNDGVKRTDVTLEYDLIIKTTTNLPLEYSVYLNENYDDTDATNIIKTSVDEADSDGTYFKTITLPTKELSYKKDETDTYQLAIVFPARYNSSEYQNILEYIEVSINARQKT